MSRIGRCVFYGACVFAVVFSLFWLGLPRLAVPSPPAEEAPVSSLPSTAAQAQPEQSAQSYYLCDEGGRVAVYAYSSAGTRGRRLALTSIYTKLLPEADALRLKHGFAVDSEAELRALLEDLGG